MHLRENNIVLFRVYLHSNDKMQVPLVRFWVYFIDAIYIELFPKREGTLLGKYRQVGPSVR